MHHVLLALAEKWYGTVLMDEDVKRLQRAVKVTKMDLWGKSEDDLIKALKDTGADIHVTCWGSPLTSVRVMEAAPQYKYMAHCAGGIRDQVTRDAIEKGLLVTNWGTVTSRSTAEGAFAMTFAVLRRYHLMVDWMRKDRGYWDTPRFEEGLFNQRVGLHGFGAIAQEYAKFLAPFGCRISAYSPHVPDEVFARYGVSRAASLEELYSTNRIISNHAAKTDANYRIVGAELLGMIEDGGYFINTGRGATVDEAALIAELKKGRITAALDVYEEEPLAADSPLRDIPNCLCIPHRAGPTFDRRCDMGAHAVDNIISWINGGPVDGAVDAKKYDLMT